MGGIFGVVSKGNCAVDLYFGVDYHSHLGTKKAGMAIYSEGKWERSIHGLENVQFRARFTHAVNRMSQMAPGNVGIGCISDTDAQPILVQSKFGLFSITTVGRINNLESLANELMDQGVQFVNFEDGGLNQTELVAKLINQKASISEGMRYAQERIDGSMTMLVANAKGIYAARDLVGRTPLNIAIKGDGSLCVSFESHAYLNMGYQKVRDLGPGEIVFLSAKGVEEAGPSEEVPAEIPAIEVKKAPLQKKRVCSFLWTYYGYPTASYEGINVEESRYRCGALLARADKEDGMRPTVDLDAVDGVPDSGLAAAIGYANQSEVHFKRAFIKYTPTWPRSFMPANQDVRDQIAHMKLIPVKELIQGQKLLFIDDSIVRGTQLRDAAELLYKNGAKEIHIRPACPPIMYGCKYINFSRSTSDMDLIARRMIVRLEGGVPSEERLKLYLNEKTPEYQAMVEEIRKEMHFTSLKYPTLKMTTEAIGIPECDLCTYCWNGRE